MLFSNLTDIIESMFMLPPRWFVPSVFPRIPILIPLASPLNVPTLLCGVGVMPILTLISRSTAVANKDLETVRPKIAYGLPGCTCGFTVGDATAAPSAAAFPRGEVGGDVKEPVDIGVTRRKGGREGRVVYSKPLNGVVLMDRVFF